jgi:hypothetical protein
MRVTLQAVALALLVAACGPARETAAGADPTYINVPPADITTEIVGASPQQEELLRFTLSGVGDRRIKTVAVEEVENGWGDPGDVGLKFTPRPEATDDMRMSWEAFLIGDAFAERSRDLNLPPVAYVSIPGETSVVGAPNDPSRRSEATIRDFVARLEKASVKAKAEVREIEVLKPLGYAVAVTVEVPDPANFLDQRAHAFFERLGEGPADFDLRFVDSSGARVSENWHAGSGGAVWIRHELEGCSPYLVSGPTDYKPPPCPVEPGTNAELHVETVPPSKVTTTIIGGTPKQRTIIEETLAGLGPTQIHSVYVRAKVDQAWAGATPDSVGIDVKYKGTDGFTDWQSSIVGNVFGRRSLELGLQPVAVVGVNGDRSANSDWSSDAKEVPMTREDANKALRRVAEIAAEHGASTSMRLFEPSRLAFALEFRTAKPAKFLHSGLRPALRPIDTENHEGSYVLVLDANGDRVLEAGGGVWVRPDLLSCSPYGYYGSPDMPELPPCPA